MQGCLKDDQACADWRDFVVGLVPLKTIHDLAIGSCRSFLSQSQLHCFFPKNNMKKVYRGKCG